MCLIATLKLGGIARFIVKSCLFCDLGVFFIFYVLFRIHSDFSGYSIYGSPSVMDGQCSVSGMN